MDSSLKSMLQCLDITEDDQDMLAIHHQITDYQSLNDKYNDLKNQSLVNFPLEQQLILAATLVIDLVDEEEEEEEVEKEMEEEEEEDTDKHGSDNSNNVSSEENDTFDMTYQGFDKDDDEDSIVSLDDDDNNNDDDANNKVNPFEYSSLSSMEFDGRKYHRWKCYHLQNIVVGIKSFVSASKVYCIRVIPTSKTVLGVGEEGEEFCDRIPYVQLKKQVLICLSKLGEENEMLNLIPDWIYEPRRDSRSSQSGRPITFSYIRDRTNLNTSNKYLSNNSNLIRVRRKGLIRVLENIPTISGSGSCMHSAFRQYGFQIAMSVFEMNTNDYVSNDATAVAEFKMNNNNTDLPIYYGNMDEFTRDLEYSSNNLVNIGRVDVIIYTATLLSVKRSGPYCRNKFSIESNRFIDWLRIKQPLIGVFDSDDVSRFWSKVRIKSYLQKICTECIKLGYQIRVMILGSKLFVKMPNYPPYNNNVTNVVSDGNNGHTFPMYSIEESIARNVRDSTQYLHEEEIVYLNLDEDGDGDNHYGENDGVNHGILWVGGILTKGMRTSDQQVPVLPISVSPFRIHVQKRVGVDLDEEGGFF
ncbi:hypothetical protein FRACYDRAFT_250220 [Fragilariopsis cylindrus CCMP1102]|uniref:Uncharacterized protein n=1 Tax=Fragilariopsis cylindrus CCMP1102 TaxID=635003 RepID=A0A1E7EPT7_9STRA|nr:hypothetical protein FRACYDRAFT_250220 [Fragilariopsis cylindrus CCMP1102]|eukprot:OEU08000.1 hypothetical protein FRACYDRAFT_250220 [Fragilariopsis cylindrus CCMP1102]